MIMSEPTKTPSPNTNSGMPVKFVHERAPLFRTVHADGAWGGASASTNVHLTFFSERPPIPRSVIMEISPEGTWLDKEPVIEVATDANVVRQFEVEVTMSLDIARVVHQVLQNFIKMAEDMRKEPERK